MVRCSVFLALALFAWIASSAGAKAEGAADPGMATLRLTAALGAGAPLDGGLHWRIFSAHADADGAHALVAESSLAQPSLKLPAGDYVLESRSVWPARPGAFRSPPRPIPSSSRLPPAPSGSTAR